MTPDFSAKARATVRGCTHVPLSRFTEGYLPEGACEDCTKAALSAAYAAGAASRQGDMDQAGGRKEFALGETVSALDSAIRELTLIRGEVEKWMASATSALATEQAGGKP